MPTNFLEYSGGTNGFLTAPVTMLTTELNALASGAAATSSVAGSFSQSTFSSGQILTGFFTFGGASTPTAGGVLAGWWLRSTDGGTTFESLLSTPSTSVPALPRAPDFLIPVYEGGAAMANGSIKWAASEFLFPWLSAKVVLQNLSGAALSASGHTLKIGSVANQY